MAEDLPSTSDDIPNGTTGKPLSDLDSPTTPDSGCNYDSGLEKSEIKSDSLGSSSSLSSSGEVGHGSTNGHKSTHDPKNRMKTPHTSSPVCVSTQKGNVRFDIDSRHDSVASFISDVSNDTSFSIDSRDVLHPAEVRVPIVGYEIMEERAKFTVFKIKVQRTEGDSWYVFRRYTDFVRLNERVKKRFPGLSLALPPKRWFKDNYDKNFLEDRLLGLQAFVDNCTSHKDICNSKPVREFFCFDDPPGPHDSIEESRVYCESLEDSVSTFRTIMDAKNREIELLKEQLDLYKGQVEELSKTLSTQTLHESKINRQKLKEYSPS